ncbi:carboxypeptidase M32 [Nioella sediminis]|jgi:carboxypeptidase Taq|uniref:carboxypeptidase M32 n=1 Tax=Nioella sediminis TaxID=1912092 RepID=UPI0008FCEB20|nr:carboxypeptidase M32 [Nioella sediminis]TBX27911.1 peptidase M32 [Roseovarius sp. JS7-11]
MSAYDDLIAHQKDTQALSEVMGRLGWDQETMMPRGAADQRAEEMAAMESVLHARRTDPRVGDWLDRAEASGDVARANLRLIRREYDRATKVPADLAKALAKATSRAQGIWAEARANEDVAAFLPTLAEILRLRREEAAAIAGDADPYDALLQDYEPGITGAELEALFSRMRPRLVDLRGRVLSSGYNPEPLKGHFPEAAQLALSAELAAVFGYDFDRGRIDKAVHPFSSGSGHDARITTRVDESEPFGCLYSTIHEVGHACYELNIDDAYLLTILGGGVSMGVHESQSRSYENQMGRSRAFTGWLFGKMTETFGNLNVKDADAFHAAVNRVQSGYIRTEADEVHYNLHILLRFDLERALITGDLQVADLEAAWNDRFAADFGVAVDKPSNGMLQDVHWSVGLFGYFPTYTLGNVYAGCLFKTLREDLPHVDAQMAKGDLSGATGWMAQNLQTHGGLYEPGEVVERAARAPVSEAPLLDYLDAKFGAIYGV